MGRWITWFCLFSLLKNERKKEKSLSPYTVFGALPASVLRYVVMGSGHAEGVGGRIPGVKVILLTLQREHSRGGSRDCHRPSANQI